ncbi:RluA family pseudouridine synthase [Aureispira anguillae]|uniref:RNA pseudouridine synthase n=1 Tax=Aureispira anguillae TaxID=2864201 RepID=A0A915YGD6_9BACT|nr:RNA pseudouridine synthase [Aureispira anguillae]BDS12540.1 RNA pseudouridine synthase [Aureispira anguillae]
MFQKLKVIEDASTYIVVNKRAGLITERNPFEIITVESLVEEYLTTGNRTPYSLDRNQVAQNKGKKNFKAPTKSKNAAFVGIVHRLDRVTSGTMVFAKKKNVLKKLNDQISNRKIKKTYLAIVENKPPHPEGTLRHQLVKNQKAKRADIFKNPRKGSVECTLSYALLKSSANGHLLRIELQTGRFHQIRAQLAHIGCPIIGDEKYGATKKYLPLAICLHAWKLQFRDPATNEEVAFEADVPRTRFWQDFSHIL